VNVNRIKTILLAILASAVWQFFWIGIQSKKELCNYMPIIVAILLCFVVAYDNKKNNSGGPDYVEAQ